MEKRYQYWTKDGLKWTSWFKWTGQDCPKYQLKNKLLNEYRG